MLPVVRLWQPLPLIRKLPLGLFFLAGSILWFIGFFVEVMADHQKSQFNREPANSGKFILQDCGPGLGIQITLVKLCFGPD